MTPPVGSARAGSARAGSARAAVRPRADLAREQGHFADGAGLVAGIDEVGRGALAGPVTVGVVVVGSDTGPCPDGLTDSKLLSAKARVQFGDLCRAWCVAWGIGHAQASEIDAIGITAALRLAALRALGVVRREVDAIDVVLLDGSHDWLSHGTDLFSSDVEPDDPDPLGSAVVHTVVKGDVTCASISAASVLAKCERDDIMVEAARSHPDYGWESNKGYGAPVHLEALRRLGPSPMHRTSWRLP